MPVAAPKSTLRPVMSKLKPLRVEMTRIVEWLCERLAVGAGFALAIAVFAAGAASSMAAGAGSMAGAASIAWPAKGAIVSAAPPPLPEHLRDTGLYVAGSTSEVRPENLSFSPQYPLWSDGATKRRWLYLPPGTSIDASRPNAWDFPPGTRLWKEFSHDRRVETRMIERLADGSWRFAAYVWNEDGSDAVLAPAAGVRALPVRGAPDGRYAVPSEADCRACHEGGATPVLGASALQLSPDRDPLAPHAELAKASDVDLRALVASGKLRNLPPALLESPPRIAAASPTERAALGYLHGNCAHCHNRQDSAVDQGGRVDAGAAVPVDLSLAQDVGAGAAGAEQVLRSAVGAPSRFRSPGMPADAHLVEPGRPDESVLAVRMRSRNPNVQMPPLGTQVPDTKSLALIERWIANELQSRKETKP